MPEQIQSIIANLKNFGVRRLALMGGIAALVMAVIGIGSIYLNRPAYETLYVGLDRSDINQISLVLADAGIGFDVGSDGTSVLVPAGTTAQARMLLAEKGLPTSAKTEPWFIIPNAFQNWEPFSSAKVTCSWACALAATAFPQRVCGITIWDRACTNPAAWPVSRASATARSASARAASGKPRDHRACDR